MGETCMRSSVRTSADMTVSLNVVLQALQDRLGAQPCDFCGDPSLMIGPLLIHEATRMLRDEFGFEMLTDETASDYWPEENPRFHVVYNFNSLKHRLRLSLRVPVDGQNPTIPSIESVYPNANWFEREIWDMFGIRFEGHSDPRRILMPSDWEGHPLRKDYPLGYEEPQFTFNFDEITRHKPHGGLEEA
jgi:NADH-quinone oxidoreductase subunit C